MEKAFFLFFTIVILNSCGNPHNCQSNGKVPKFNRAELITLSESRDKEQQGPNDIDFDLPYLIVVTDYFIKPVFFDKNCSATDKLESTKYMIGGLLRNEYIQIRIVGNSDNREQISITIIVS